MVDGFATHPVQQLPDTQRPPVHAVRLATAGPSTQTGLPLAQSMTPLRHGLGLLVQAWPATHATHEPALQTPPGQAVPVPTLPDSTQTALPELQFVLPVLHGFAGLQEAPCEQGLHEPPLHTPPGHDVPFILLLPLVQTPLPELQSMTPF